MQSIAAAVIGAGALALGVIGSRPDVAVLGLPFVLGFAWAWFTRPEAGPHQDLRQGAHRPTAGTDTDDAASGPSIGNVAADLTLDPEPGAEVVRVRVTSQGHRQGQALIDVGGGSRTVRMHLETARTGVQPMFRTDLVWSSYDETLIAGPVRLGPLRVTVYPTAVPLRRLPLPRRLQGLTGPHTSRRVGDGTDLHDVNLFTPGDRLRRIDWRVSARRSLDVTTGRLGELYVRRTFATADATVMLVVDSRDNVGPDVDTWGGGKEARVDEPTSLDLAREAATSLAKRYLDGGDRVGLDDLGLRRRPVAPAGGRKQWDRITQRLATIAPEGSPTPRERAPQVSAAALVVVFSTFLDDEAARMAQQWHAQAHRVIAVDVLPEVRVQHLDTYQQTAYSLVRLERGIRLERLRRAGVEVVHWVGDPDGHGSPTPADVDLLVLSRPGHRMRTR
ncbi:DUF58 domain-containing protein [Occultella glacieicola]|uniref:DUF58 domain-containing protein n=1 Tax=Occultella glacieicola TaxID=2518684 RepID=A0ABY2E930_9MICO|nr:DUF58 domain-containing protein [Occultella glacieicola]TDE97497.1 DUF58 domain-containing protein [Occultella glacieicola]